MICVSIGRGRHRHMIAEHRHLVDCGAKFVELRLDWINGEVNLKRLLVDRPGPVIIACRREAEGGKWTGSEPERLMLLRTAIVEGVEYIDLEVDVADSIPRFGKTKRVVSYHNFRKTPDDLAAIHRQLCSLDADVVKLATMANQPNDNLRMLQMIGQSKQPTVGFCMGDIGTPSRILCGRFGASWTYATFHHERVLVPGKLSFQQMTEIYHYDEINAETAVYGVIADPVGHSLGPQVHNAAFRHAGVNAVYLPFLVRAETLINFWPRPALGHSRTERHHSAQGVGGPQVGQVRPGRQGNWRRQHDRLRWRPNDRLQHRLPRRSIASIGPCSRPEYDRGPIEGKTVLVLGAGGAARAIVYGLKRRGANVVVAGRTSSRADQLASQMQCRVVDWTARHSVSPDVVINCTPVGMHPNLDESPFEKHRFAARDGRIRYGLQSREHAAD